MGFRHSIGGFAEASKRLSQFKRLVPRIGDCSVLSTRCGGEHFEEGSFFDCAFWTAVYRQNAANRELRISNLERAWSKEPPQGKWLVRQALDLLVSRMYVKNLTQNAWKGHEEMRATGGVSSLPEELKLLVLSRE